MARIGTFDALLDSKSWFDPTLRPEGWYSDDLIIAPTAAGTVVWIKVSGVWKQAIPYIKVAGVWKQATPYIKVSGVWK